MKRDKHLKIAFKDRIKDNIMVLKKEIVSLEKDQIPSFDDNNSSIIKRLSEERKKKFFQNNPRPILKAFLEERLKGLEMVKEKLEIALEVPPDRISSIIPKLPDHREMKLSSLLEYVYKKKYPPFPKTKEDILRFQQEDEKAKLFLKVIGEIGKKEKELEKIIFRPKSNWQKDDCINRGKEYNCPNKSTLEVAYENEEEGYYPAIRCCEDPRCKAKALELIKSEIEFHYSHRFDWKVM